MQESLAVRFHRSVFDRLFDWRRNGLLVNTQ